VIDALEEARCRIGLAHTDLWLRYFELGGMSTALELEAYLSGALEATSHDRDVIAVALNERFSELATGHVGATQLVAYSDDEDGWCGQGDARAGQAP